MGLLLPQKDKVCRTSVLVMSTVEGFPRSEEVASMPNAPISEQVQHVARSLWLRRAERDRLQRETRIIRAGVHKWGLAPSQLPVVN